MRPRNDLLWQQLQTAWLAVPVATRPRSPANSTWEDLPGRLDRCFQQVSSYVGQRVNDREALRRIVTEVLAGSLDLFVAPCDKREELRRLKESSDWLLATRRIGDSSGHSGPISASVQPVNATLSLNTSAGERKASVFRGRWFN